MKPNIVFLDEYTLGGADLTRLHELGRYTGYSTTAPDEVADRFGSADISFLSDYLVELGQEIGFQ